MHHYGIMNIQFFLGYETILNLMSFMYLFIMHLNFMLTTFYSKFRIYIEEIYLCDYLGLNFLM